MQQLAVLSARLHDASPPLPTAPPGALSARSVRYFDVPDLLSELPPPHRAVLTAARDRAAAAVEQLWQTSDTPPRLVHGDLTPSNVVAHRGQLSAIDFQDLSWAHVEQDLAHSIYGVTRGVDLAAGLTAFRAGYEQLRPWPQLDLALLTDLVAARRVSMVNLAVVGQRPGLAEYVERHADALRFYLG
ncbi:phosphotransferase enzyme family protein [uncultured Jatrophihabitans sp.]|uniref:phosphotransferase enzyme family protein n=1 Tax=uncultured Jatrophihabitans sp. TaxID=1610747 RepID=UPI0035CC0F33